MSINSAMLSGVSALIANSAALGATSDNISNVNTVGYKENETQFEDLVTSKANAGNYNSGGVQADVTQLVSQQGQFTQTQSNTDMAINGNGFFVVSSAQQGLGGGTPSFTRAGSFTADADGYLQNTAGLYLQGWAADSNGVITTSPSDLSKLSTINVDSVANAPNPTSTAAVNANLDSQTTPLTSGYTDGQMAAGTVTPDYSTQLTVYDGQGGQHTVNLDFRNVSGGVNNNTTPASTYAANTWAMEATSPDGTVTSDGTTAYAATVTFNSDGSLNTTASAIPADLDIKYTNTGLNPAAGYQSVALNLGGGSGSSSGALTQYASTSTVNSTVVNGGPPSAVTKVTVGTDGKVTANFANGATRTIAQVAIGTFPDPDGLAASSGNAYVATGSSGTFNLKQAGTGGAGSVESSQLEASTVDLSTEFTNLIITQRAYSAASKIITTADQMLQELISVKQ